MTRREIRSSSDLEREKFRYLQPRVMGGQAKRMCTSLAPLWYKNSVVSRSWVPRTKESSMRINRLSRISASTGISFMRAIKLRLLWVGGMKERGQVGVYLMKGRAKGMPERLA